MCQNLFKIIHWFNYISGSVHLHLHLQQLTRSSQHVGNYLFFFHLPSFCWILYFDWMSVVFDNTHHTKKYTPSWKWPILHQFFFQGACLQSPFPPCKKNLVAGSHIKRFPRQYVTFSLRIWSIRAPYVIIYPDKSIIWGQVEWHFHIWF